MCDPEIWEKWAIYDKDGICEIKKDAPEDMKNAYYKWKENQDYLRSQSNRMKKY